MTHQLPENPSSSGSLEQSNPAKPSAMTTTTTSTTHTLFRQPPGLIRRAVSSDCGALKPRSPSRRWTNDHREGPRLNTADIFRVPSNAEKQSRNESSLPFTERDEDDDSGEGRQSVGGGGVPQDRMDRALTGPGSMHSPIGTRADSSNQLEVDENAFVPIIRPSLSCPTSGFESPLFQNRKILASPGDRMEGIRSNENSPGEADELDELNVSGIEYNEEPSFQLDEDSDDFAMRNLNERFELLLHDDQNIENITSGSSNQYQGGMNISNQINASNVNFDGSEHKSDATAAGPPGLPKPNSKTKPSPTSVFSLKSKSESPTKITTTQLDNGVKIASVPMPTFHLHESLSGVLSQGLIDRVSFYSVVRDINKEAIDAAMSDPRGSVYNDGSVHGRKGATPNGGNTVVAEDGKVHVHPNPEEESKSVLVMAACMSESSSDRMNCPSTDVLQPPPMGAALLDEEWWLLGAIATRSPEEVAINKATKLLPTFSEAMGEKDDSGEGKNPAASSKTQLWKPGRSWWEAKSGKNPWVEPVVHNNRWRYLWPLIHYHKFIAKCIKKLKRNAVDVKTSTSAVAMFLRQEVCNVSDHLAAMSKYDSEEWTNALSHFDGWTNDDPEISEIVKNLVAGQRLHGPSELSDSQSSLLLSEVGEKVLKAMQAVKEEAARSGEDYDYSLGPKDASFASRDVPKGTRSHNLPVNGGDAHHSFSTHNSSTFNVSYHNPKGHCPIPRHPNFGERSWNKAKPRGADYHHPYHHQGMYGPQFDHHHHFDSLSHGPYGHPPFGGAMNHQYYQSQFGRFDHHPHHHAHSLDYQHGGEPGFNGVTHGDPFGHNQYYPGYYPHPDGSFHDCMGFDTSMHLPEMNATSYMHPSPMAQTPGRIHGNDLLHNQYPPSPHWSHLNISQLPGLVASPSTHQTPPKPPGGSTMKSNRKRHGKGTHMIDGKAKGLIMFPNTNSPASRFVMSPQDKKTNPYYTKSHASAQRSALMNQSAHEESFVLPKIEDYSAESPVKAGHASFHTDTSMQLMPPTVKKIYAEKKGDAAQK